MKRVGFEWQLIDTPIQLEEISAPPTPPSNVVRVYAKDKAGASALYLKDDAGSEREIGPANAVTGTGASGRLAFWTGTSTIGSSANFLWNDSDTRLHLFVAGANSGLHIERSNGQANFNGYRITGSATVADALLAIFAGGGSHTGASSDRVVTSLFGVYAGENWTSTAKGSYLTLETTPLLSTTRAERFRIGPSGQFGIGGATYGSAGQAFLSGGASAAPAWTSLDHGTHLAGLTDDDHTIYALLAGRSGGQTLKGGTGSGDDLTLQSTNHATKGNIFFGSSTYDEVNNRLGINDQTPDNKLTVADTDTTAARGLRISQWSGDTVSANFQFAKSRGTSVDSHTALLADDVLGALAGFGSDGSSFGTATAQIRLIANENFSATNKGSRVDITTTPDGATTPLQRLLIENSGLVHIKPVGTTDVELEVSDGSSQGGGTIHRAASGTHSSRTRKVGIKELPTKRLFDAITDIKALQPVAFRYRVHPRRAVMEGGALIEKPDLSISIDDPTSPEYEGYVFEDAPSSIKGSHDDIIIDKRILLLEMAMKAVIKSLEARGERWL